jgi:hypothetical protein
MKGLSNLVAKEDFDARDLVLDNIKNEHSLLRGNRYRGEI